jgi:hypothetical protein
VLLKRLVLRDPFLSFSTIFDRFWRFLTFSGADFSGFVVFSIFGDGILANRTRGCTIAHPETIVKPRNWAPKVTILSSLLIWG